MTTTQFWWLRHAPVVDNGGLVYGGAEIDADTSHDPTYTALSKILPSPAIFICSGLSRTTQTLQAVRKQGRKDIPRNIPTDSRLNEQSLGDWHGKPIKDVFPNGGPWPQFWMLEAEKRAPGGESFNDLCLRVNPAIQEMTRTYEGKSIVIAAHGGTIRAAIALALQLKPSSALAFTIENCSITRIDHIKGSGSQEAWRISGTNLTPR